MEPTDNSQYTDAQLTDVYRREHMAHLERQTKALESIRGIMLFFTILFVLGVVIWVLVTLSASSSGL